MAPPFTFAANPRNPYERLMMRMLGDTNSIIYMDEKKNFKIRGDGVRLHIPFDYVVMSTDEELHITIIRGIRVSLRNQELLGY